MTVAHPVNGCFRDFDVSYGYAEKGGMFPPWWGKIGAFQLSTSHSTGRYVEANIHQGTMTC